MEWLQTPLAVGLAALFAGLFTWLATRTQIKAQTEREDRQWMRQVASKALLAFSDELALMISKSREVIGFMKVAHTSTEVSAKHVKGLVDTAVAKWRDYYETGAFRYALFRLDDEEIIEGAEAIDDKLIRSIDILADLSVELSEEEVEKAITLYTEAEAKARELQSLIKKRLQEP